MIAHPLPITSATLFSAVLHSPLLTPPPNSLLSELLPYLRAFALVAPSSNDLLSWDIPMACSHPPSSLCSNVTFPVGSP